MFTIEPCFCFTINGSAALVKYCTPISETRKHLSHSSSEASREACHCLAMYAALLQRISKRPLLVAALFTARRPWVAEATLHWMNEALPPVFRICATTVSPAASSRSAINTFAPSSAKTSAIARPRPCAPPVTIAVLFSSRILIGQRLALSSNFCACDRSPRQIRDIKLVKSASAEGHVRWTSEENRPSIPGEQSFLTRGIDSP